MKNVSTLLTFKIHIFAFAAAPLPIYRAGGKVTLFLTMDFKELYHDSTFPASFTGKNTFIKGVQSRYPNVKAKDVEKALKAVDSYTLHKPTRRQPLFRRIFTKGINYLYQIDLVDMRKFADENDGYTMIITIIDTFSKKAWAFKLKDKSASSIWRVMKTFLMINRPNKIAFDQGTEFYNKPFLDLLKTYAIQHYSVYSQRKGAIIERFNRTLKTRMYRSFTARGTHRWIDILQDLINGYNNTKHTSIGYAPNEVNTSNENKVRKKLFPKIKKERQHTKAVFKIGDSVRITRQKSVFQKGYDQSFSYEVFEVSKIKNTYPVTYGIKDYKGLEIQGSFYKNELQQVDKSNNIWPIEKIVQTRRRQGRTEYLVKFLGYPEEANTWIPQSELFDL